MSKRIRVFEAEEIARDIRETFADREVEYEKRIKRDWPKRMQQIGQSLAVAYESDKWKPKKLSGKRDTELYKHLAESTNWAYATPRLLYDYYTPSKAWPTEGPVGAFRDDIIMPTHFAILGLCEAVHLQLYSNGEIASGDESVVEMIIPKAMLGASKMKHGSELRPFLFVYTESEGVHLLIVGDRLDVKADGIVG